MKKIVLAHELLEEGVSKSHIAQHLGVSRRTIIRWSQAIEKLGSLDAFLEYYQQAKQGARRKRKIDAIRMRFLHPTGLVGRKSLVLEECTTVAIRTIRMTAIHMDTQSRRACPFPESIIHKASQLYVQIDPPF